MPSNRDSGSVLRWRRVRGAIRSVVDWLPTPLETLGWWAVSLLLLGLLVAAIGYGIGRIVFAVPAQRALLYVSTAIPIVCALGLGWKLGATVNRPADPRMAHIGVPAPADAPADDARGRGGEAPDSDANADVNRTRRGSRGSPSPPMMCFGWPSRGPL